MIGGAVIVLVGVLGFDFPGSDHDSPRFWIGLALVIGGPAVELGGAWTHDYLHRRKGEVPHALWGKNDHNRPRFLGGPRT